MRGGRLLLDEGKKRGIGSYVGFRARCRLSERSEDGLPRDRANRARVCFNS
jgi:hypothetical protein